MSFWGLSTAGREAKGFPREYGNWNEQQFKDYLDKANQFGQQGGYYRGRAGDFWNAQAAEGAPGIQQVRGYGQEIMPYQGALDSRMGRLNQIMQQYGGGVNPAGTTAGNISNYLDQSAGNISRTGDQLSNEVNEAARRMTTASDTGYNDIISNLIGQSGNLKGMITGGYGGLQSTSAAGAKAIRDVLEGAGPAGEFQAATAARAFAPAKANVMRSLRASGVDPNSPEGMAALSNVNEQQARAIDDRLGAGIERQAERLAGADTAELNRQLGLGEAGLTGAAGVDRNLLAAVPGLQEAGLGSRLGIERGRTGATTDILRESRDLSNQLLGQRANNEQLTRAMQREDWGTVADIMGQMNQEDLLGVNLGQQQFGQGADWAQLARQMQGEPFEKMYGMGQQDIQNMFNSAITSQNFGQDALKAMMQQYGIELPNAGWGSKMLAGIGMGAANALVPGLGSAVGSAAGGGGGGGGGGGLDFSKLFKLFGGGGGNQYGAGGWT